MPAGASDRLVIPSFNRGWARYPLLAAGRYTITFSYQPQWNDPTWTEDSFGLVRSEPVTVEVTDAAPEAIRSADAPVRLHLKRDGESLVAEVESTWDHELWLNLNWGDDIQTHARLEWVAGNVAGEEHEVARWGPESTGATFSRERVRLLRPGERLVIGRAPVATLREEVRKLARPPAKAEVFARYASLASAPQIQEATAEQGRAVEAPTHLFSGALSTAPMPLEAP